MIAANGIQRIRRRKPAKSCSFCRHRKLKCDQKRPICSSCKSRNLSNCEYPVADAFIQSGMNDSLNDNTNIYNEPSHAPVIDTTTLMMKVESLERQIDEISKNSPSVTYDGISPKVSNSSNNSSLSGMSPSTRSAKSTVSTIPTPQDDVFQNFNQHLSNPLADFYYLQSKPSGRKILYGATSVRTSLFKHKFGFGKKYDQLWGKVKLERTKWKKQHNTLTSVDLDLVEKQSDSMFNTLLDRLCFELPPYNKCIEIINLFFDSTLNDLSPLNSTLDKNKVINDFYTCFIPDSDHLLPSGDRKIKMVLAGNKRNYYKVGAIIQIISLRHFCQNCPESVDIFSIYLLGQCSPKIFFIERLQFLLLRSYYLKTYRATGDDSNIINMVSNMVSTAITIGLDRNIDQLYKGQENVVGRLQSLKNMWMLIVFLDLECSLRTGRPLKLVDIDLDYQSDALPFDGDLKLIKLSKMTRLGRKIMKCIYAKRGSPKFQGLVDLIIDFMERELPNISYFTEPESLVQVGLDDVRIVNFCLEMILCLNDLNFAINDDIGLRLRNSSIHISLLAFHIIVAVTERCFQLDYEHFPEMFTETSSNITPYVAQSIGYNIGLLPRITSIFCAVVYYRLTIFVNNDFLFYNQKPFSWDTKNLRASKEEISVLFSLDRHKRLCEKWFRPKDPIRRKIMANSYYFVITNAMQSTLRKVLEKCLEYRKRAEEAWVSQLGDEIKLDCGSYPAGATAKEFEALMVHQTRLDTHITEGLRPSSMTTDTKQKKDKEMETDSPINYSTYELHAAKDQPPRKDDNNQTAGISVGSFDQHSNNEEAVHSTQDKSNNKNLIEEKEAEMLQQITDEFWSSYNSGWEELLNHTNPQDIFNNSL
ncbi:zinc finger transcription factor Yrm1p [Monosporozyma servazzii]